MYEFSKIVKKSQTKKITSTCVKKSQIEINNRPSSNN